MTSATDELRRLLDERGVPWKDYGYENHTWWGEWHAENRSSVNGLFMKVEGVVTPAQAIDATLGRGTCHAIEVPMGIHDDATATVCSACRVAIDELSEMNYCPNCGRRVDNG